MAESYGRDTHLLSRLGEQGGVYIADDVVASISVIAAQEVEGVDSMAGGIYKKSVRVEMTEENVSIDLAINIKYNFSIPETCAQVQEKVKASVESMTGLSVTEVNVKIAGVSIAQ